VCTPFSYKRPPPSGAAATPKIGSQNPLRNNTPSSLLHNVPLLNPSKGNNILGSGGRVMQDALAGAMGTGVFTRPWENAPSFVTVPAQITIAANHAFPSSDKSLASLFDSSPT
jgi:hypothetical protein